VGDVSEIARHDVTQVRQNIRPENDLPEIDIKEVIAKQQALGKRLIWLLVPPLVIACAMIPMIFTLSSRLSQVEVGEKLVNIESRLESDKNYPEAIKQYESLAASSPTALMLARLGILYFLNDKNDAAKAIEKLEMAKRLDPKSSEIFRNLMWVYAGTRRLKDAVEAGQMALTLSDDEAAIYNNLAWIFANPGDQPQLLNLPRAREYAERAVELTKGKQVDFLDTLGDVYYHLGDRENAIKAFSKAKEVALGDIKKVEDEFKASSKLYPDDFKKLYPNDSQ
jgi:tetratricopeptide (TPR) repeat protein